MRSAQSAVMRRWVRNGSPDLHSSSRERCTALPSRRTPGFRPRDVFDGRLRIRQRKAGLLGDAAQRRLRAGDEVLVANQHVAACESPERELGHEVVGYPLQRSDRRVLAGQIARLGV
jgi:hypothetical protein